MKYQHLHELPPKQQYKVPYLMYVFKDINCQIDYIFSKKRVFLEEGDLIEPTNDFYAKNTNPFLIGREVFFFKGKRKLRGWIQDVVCYLPSFIVE